MLHRPTNQSNQSTTVQGLDSLLSEPAQDKPRGKPTETSSQLEELEKTAKSIVAFCIDKNSIAEENETEKVAEVVNRQSLLDIISKSASALAAYVEGVKTINRLASVSEDRPEEIAREILPIAVSHLRERKMPGLQPAESRLVSVAKSSNKDCTYLPQWFNSISSLITLIGVCKNLPHPEQYLTHSKKGEEQSRGLRLKIRVLDNDLEAPAELSKISGENTRIKEEAAANNVTVDMKKLIYTGDEIIGDPADVKATIREKLDKYLLKLDDIDPREVPQVLKSITINAVPSPELINAIINSRKSIGQAIVQLSSKETDSSEPFALEASELIGGKTTTNGPGQVQKISPLVLNGSPLLATEEKLETIRSLLETYTILHKTLVNSYHILCSADLPAVGTEHHNLKQELEKELETLLPANIVAARDTLLSLAKHKELRESLGDLLESSVIYVDRGNANLVSPLAQNENLQLLGLAIDIRLHHENEFKQSTRRATALQVIEPLIREVKQCVEEKDLLGLVKLFSGQIQKLTNRTHSSKVEKVAVLQVLLSVSEDSVVRSCLKGKLPNLEDVDKIAESLQKSMLANDAPHTRFIEELRAKVKSRFSFNLLDYFGQQELVTTWKQQIEDHLELLRNKEAWIDMPPDQLFFNGYLLFGEPGAGKSFLVQCMANEFSLPLISLSREDMAEVSRESEKDKSSFEGAFSSFLDSKIKEANKAKEKNGALAAFIFIDELEAEFMNRDPKTGRREEITRTNIMLRVIEKLIKQNPDIIFIGATNYIDLVDKAALRTGRFGIHHETRLPTEEDITIIIKGTLARVGIGKHKLLYESDQGEELVKSFTGMTPLEIQICLNQTIALTRIKNSSNNIVIDESFLKAAHETSVLLKRSKKQVST